MTSIYRSPEGARAVQESYAQLLDQWPLAHERLCVPTRHGDTFVLTCGPETGPPLILLQGSGANTAMWIRDVAAWTECFRVHAVDIIGEPGSSAPSRPPLASGAYALWLDDVLTGLGLSRVSMVAVSLGGWVALSFATRNPERVERLVLLCPAGVGRQRVWPFLKLMPLLFLGARGRRKAMAIVAGRTLGPKLHSRDPLAQLLAVTFRHFRPRRARVPRFSDKELQKLTMPVMLIVGDGDVLLDSTESARRLERSAALPTVRLLPDMGHVIWGQTRPILDFLRDPA